MTIQIFQADDASSGWMDGNGNKLVSPNYVETVSSTATLLKRYGLTILSSTAAKTYVLDAPVIGAYKEIVKSAGSTVIITVSVGTGVIVGGSTTTTKVLFNGQNDSVILRGVSTTKWHVVGVNSVTLSA